MLRLSNFQADARMEGAVEVFSLVGDADGLLPFRFARQTSVTRSSPAFLPHTTIVTVPNPLEDRDGDSSAPVLTRCC